MLVKQCSVVLCSNAGRVRHTLLSVKTKGTHESGISSGDIVRQCVLCGGFCSRLLSRFSWERSARGDWVQVILLRFQGDADRYSGHASQYYVGKIQAMLSYKMVKLDFLNMEAGLNLVQSILPGQNQVHQLIRHLMDQLRPFRNKVKSATLG